MASNPPQPPASRPAADFDTTGELWDRLGEDLARGSGPCLETIQKLVDEACHRFSLPPASDDRTSK